LKESKLSYIALALSVGAAAISGLSGMLSVLPNSSKIDVLTEQVQVLTEQNKRLSAIVSEVDMNRIRINELDLGMTAFANVLKIDRRELAKAFNSLKAQQAADAKAATAAQRSSEDKGSSTTTQPAEHQPVPVVSQEMATQEAPEPSTSIEAISTSASAPSQQHSKPAQPAQHTSEPSNSATPLMGADNPFSAGLDNTSAAGDVAQALAVVPALAKSMSIAQVDAVLGKRLSSSWYKPAGEIEGLSTLIQLKMTRNGKVATARIAKSSGNSIFDNSALSAVKSIGTIEEVGQLSDADFKKAYESRPIQFTPQMGR